MRHTFLLAATLGAVFHIATSSPSQAQIKIGGSGTPVPSAVLELESTTQGFLPPRMTTVERDAIVAPVKGMVIFNATLGCLQLYTVGGWVCLGNTATPATYPPRLTTEQIDALPSPQPGDLAFDLTFGCLRYYHDGRWVCSDRKSSDRSPEATAWGGGGNSIDQAHDVAVDGSGNVYVTGYFYGTATFGTTSLTSSGGSDTFLAKYSTSGVLQWVQQAGGVGSQDGKAVSVDNSGNVYISGTFTGTATFGTTNVTSAGNNDVFLAKYSSAGAHLWVQRAGGATNDIVRSMTTDGAGNAYLTGYFEGTATFGATSLVSAGNGDVFVAKFSSAGLANWAQRAGGSSPDEGLDISLDNTGGVYVTGAFSGTATFGATNLASMGNHDVFLARYDALGNAQWAQRAGGTDSELAYGVAVDGSGFVYITGHFVGTAFFGSYTLTSAGFSDVFLAKYSSGGILQWAERGGGTESDYATSVFVDGSGKVYVSGYFRGTASFETTSLISAGLNDVFLVQYSSSGLPLWVTRAGGSGEEYASRATLDGLGNIFITGFFSENTIFGASSLSSAGSFDFFVARFKL